MRHRLHGFFGDAFDLHISSIVRFLVGRVAKLVLFVSVAEADDSPAPTLRSSLVSPLFSLLLILGSSLPNSCVIDVCWFSSISHFAMFTKSISDCTMSSLMHSHCSSFQSNTLATGCLYCLNELTAQQACVVSESKPNQGAEKTPSDKESPRYKVSEKIFRFDESAIP